MPRHRCLRCCRCCCCHQENKQGWQMMPRHCLSCPHHHHHCQCCTSKQETADDAKAPSSALPLPLSLHEQAREGWPMMPRHQHLHRHYCRCLCVSKWRTAHNAKTPPSAPPLLSSSLRKGATNRQQCRGTVICTSAVTAVVARASVGRMADDANGNGY